MDFMKTEYEFLDLTDVKEADRSSLQCALFKQTEDPEPEFKIAAAEPFVDLSTSVPATVSRSVDSAGDGEMAPHSPARAPAAPPHPAPYAQPPPAYPPPHHQWPVAPPNVYVSQVTANVNVHGYMGQYYQPQPQYAPPAPAVPQDRTGRPHRRDRRGKRAPSPPQHPPYYLQYPQYYPAAQAQGAPLYHLPVYQPVVYGHYPYPPYYQEYPMSVEGEQDKGPEDYPAEVVMEQEAVDAYYANAHYAPPYGPPVDAGVEYMPPVYLPPPQQVQPVHLPTHHHQHIPQPQPQPHQFNVHAKNFVLGQGKSYVPQDKQEPRTPPEAPTVSAASVELPMKDLKIKGPGSPKHNERPLEVNQAKVPPPTDKPKPIDPTKPAWVPENKVDPNFVHQQIAAKPFVAPVTTAQIAANKLPPAAGKSTKGPAAPFSSNKQPPKPSVPQTIVPLQQAATTPKAPFGNRQKRDGTANRSPSSEHAENDRNAEHLKREPPLPPSKAPMPISITLPAAGQPLIVANKPPFGHSRKAQVPEPPPVPQPPPPAPTASDFPPPPTPRNRGDLPPPVVAPQPQPAPGKSWASLFSNKMSTIAPPLPTPVIYPVEEPPSPTTAMPPVANIQKPVAKVQPFDASPLAQASIMDKGSPTPRPQPMPVVPPVTVAPAISYSEKAISYSEKAISYSEKTISYSEKTSANVSPAASSPVAHPKPVPAQPEPREVLVQKETTPAIPIQPSPYCDDPNSYRMGEFLSKYQLDNRAVSVLPRGLTNRSNYCYVNAILQALIACPPFYNMLKALPYQTRRGKSSTPVIDSMVELCYEFSPLGTGATATATATSRGARGAAPAPAVPAGPPLEGGAGRRVLRALRPFPGSQEGRQEDAEEFLGCLLNSLHDEMLELMKLVEPEEPKETATAQTNGVIAQETIVDEEDDDEWKVMGPKNRGAVERRWAARRTPVSDIFRGKTRVRLHRATHHDVTDAVQPFFTLQLDIERASNVKDALELLAGKDTLEGVNDAWQQLSLEQLPVVLLLHLKCFQLDSEGHTAKIVKAIDFPMDLKIDPKIMSSKQKYTSKQRLYKLFAIVYHEGIEAVKGHYVTDTYHGQSGWIRYDDATVTQVNDGMVLKAKPPRMPYLLMYRRQDTLPAHRVKPE